MEEKVEVNYICERIGHMKRRIKYTNEPIGLKIITDFLPPPEQLVLKEENIKVILALSKKSSNWRIYNRLAEVKNT